MLHGIQRTHSAVPLLCIAQRGDERRVRPHIGLHPILHACDSCQPLHPD